LPLSSENTFISSGLMFLMAACSSRYGVISATWRRWMSEAGSVK
jgi:hypothetical protein